MIKYITRTFAIAMLLSVLPVSAKTLLIGDSLMGTIGPSYQHIQSNEETTLKFVVGSGLENNSFNWFKAIDSINIANYNKIVISFGTNDYSISNNEKYKNKVDKLVKQIKQENPDVEITWIGPPAVKNQKINKGIDNVRSIIEKESVAKGFNFLDVREVLGFDFMLYKNGQKIRAGDGIHYTTLAGNLVVQKYNKEY